MEENKPGTSKKSVSWKVNGQKSSKEKRDRNVEAAGEGVSDDDDDVDKEEEEEKLKRIKKGKQKVPTKQDVVHVENGGVNNVTDEASSLTRPRSRRRRREVEREDEEKSLDSGRRSVGVRSSPPQRPHRSPNTRGEQQEEQADRWHWIHWVRFQAILCFQMTVAWSPVTWFSMSKKGICQQQLPTLWQPIWDFKLAGRIFIVLAILSIIFAVCVYCVQPPEYRFTFSEECKSSRNYLRLIRSMCVFCGGGLNPHCSKVINIPKDMQTPVFLYYELVGFHQNHRKLSKSLDYAQLYGNIFSEDGKPIEPSNDCGNYSRDAEGKIYYPCGQLANMMYNDEFSLDTPSGDMVPFRFHGIALDYFKQLRFKNPPTISPQDYYLKKSFTSNFVKPKDWTSEMWDNWWKGGGMENEKFINWMNPSAFSTLRKLYAVIDYVPKCPSGKFCKGNYTMNIEYRFDMDRFDGEKAFILASMSFFGALNYNLPTLLAFLGFLEGFLALLFMQLQSPSDCSLKHKHRNSNAKNKNTNNIATATPESTSHTGVGDGPLELDPNKSISTITKFPVNSSDVSVSVPGSSNAPSEGLRIGKHSSARTVTTLYRQKKPLSKEESREVLPDDFNIKKRNNLHIHRNAKIEDSDESEAESYTSAKSILVSAEESSPESENQDRKDQVYVRKRR